MLRFGSFKEFCFFDWDYAKPQLMLRFGSFKEFCFFDWDYTKPQLMLRFGSFKVTFSHFDRIALLCDRFLIIKKFVVLFVFAALAIDCFEIINFSIRSLAYQALYIRLE